MSLVIAAHPIKDVCKIGQPERAVKSGRGKKKVLEGPVEERKQAVAVAAEGGYRDLLTTCYCVSPARETAGPSVHCSTLPLLPLPQSRRGSQLQ